MKPKSSSLRNIGLICVAILPCASQAATVTKADNSDALNLTSSWLSGFVPTAVDVASWDSTVTGANTVSLGADASWLGIKLTNPGGAVTISSGNTLTLGTSGIDMATATNNLTISSGLTLASGHQVWNVATGRSLTLNTGTFTRSAGATLNIQGAGTVAASMTGIANTNGIIGGWATVGTGTSTRFATLSTGNLVGYTGATVQSTTASAWGGIPSGGTGLINYDITISGTPGLTGLGRNVNSLRYTGSGMTQGGNTNALLLNTNAILNAGTGTLAIGGAANQFSIAASSTATNEMVLGAAGANITINSTIVNNGANVSSLTVTGPNTVTLVGNNTFSGNLVVNSGTLAAGIGQSTAPTASNLGALQPAANRNIIVNNGGTLSLTGGNVLGTGGSTNTLSNTSLIVNSGGVFQTGLNGAGTGWWNKIGAVTLNGGTIHVGSGANNTVFQGLALIGNVTVGGSSVSTIDNFGSSNSTTNGIHLGQNATAGQIITFDVADVTGSSASDLDLSAKLLNTSANGTASGLTKTGAGTMTLSAASSYSGPTAITGGTLAVTGSGAINSTSGITINGSGAKFVKTSSAASTPAITLTQGTLDGSGSLGAVSVADLAGNTVANGNITGSTAATFSSLTFGGDATANIRLAGSSAGFVVSGALTTTPANGSVTLNANNTLWANGLNNLISYGSGSSFTLGDFTLGSITGLGARQTAATSLTDSGSAIQLFINGVTAVWTGAASGEWTTSTIASPYNWKQDNDNSATQFLASDAVLFDDSVGAGATTITINDATVTPVSATFNNTTAVAYTLSGSNGISTGTLVKNNSGALTINNANTYSSGTTLNGGTLNIGNASALGTGTLALTGGTINNTTGSSLTLAGNLAQTWNGSFAFTGTNDLNLGTGAVSLAGNSTVTTTAGVLTVGGAISGSSSLTKSGAGTLLLSGTNTYTGGTSLNSGTLLINSVSAIGSGTFTIAGGVIDNTSGSAKTLATNNVQNWNGNFTVTGTSDLGFGTGAVTLGSNVAVTTTAGNLTVGGAIGGAFSLTKEGAGSLIVSSAGTYSGGTVINGGKIISTVNLGAANSSLFIGSSGNLTFSGGANVTNAVTGTGSIITSGITVIGDQSAFAGSFTHNSGSASSAFSVPTATSKDASYIISAGTSSSQGLIAGYDTGSLTTPYTLEIGSLTGVAGSLFRGGNSAKGIAVLQIGNLNTNTTFAGAFSNGTNTSIAVTKVGTGILTLSGASNNTVATTVNGGVLNVTGSMTAAINVGGAAATGAPTLSGTGTIGGAASFSEASGGAAGVHSVGSRDGTTGASLVGTQTFSSTVSYGSGSIFEWDLSAASASDPGVVSDSATGTYDKVVAAGAVTGGSAIFKVVLSGNTFTDAFWDTDKSWTNIFSGAGTPAALSSIFSSFSATGGLDSAGLVAGEGHFSFNVASSTLNWTAVPEPTSALAGLLIGAGLLRRRRNA